MNKYSQELRVFVACCPGGGKISQKLMKKINEAADKFDTLEQQCDDLLEACKLGVLTMIEQHKALESITKGIAEKAGIEPTPIPLPPVDLINEAIAKAKK